MQFPPALSLFPVALASTLPLLLFSGPLQKAAQKQAPLAGKAAADEGWISLFNGKDLTGWTPKVRGHELGVNFADTFRVEDGLMRVSYEGYEDFQGRFGHIFYDTPFEHYRLRIEYRFVGKQCPGGPGWAFRNSGVMIHGQDPRTMTVDQDFPVSIEVQMLGGDGTNARSTGNLCTPGTHVVMKEELVKRHCINSTSETYHGDQWVTLEVEVRGAELIRHSIDGKTILEYSQPQLDEGHADGKRVIEAAEGEKILTGGSISLQAESHPVEFRKVELLPLTK